MTLLVLGLEEAPGKHVLQLREVWLRGDAEEVAWDVAVLTGVPKEIQTVRLDINLEVSHRSQLFPCVGGLLGHIHHV